MKTFSTFILGAAIIIPSCSVEKAEVSIAKFKDDKKAAVSFTYDDGGLDSYYLIAPELEKNGLRGTFWIMGNDLETDKETDRICWNHLKEMSDKGHEISNHCWTHANLTQLPEEEIRKEIKLNDDAIEKYIGKRPRTLAFPYNARNELVMKIAMEGRTGVRTFQEGQGQGRAFGQGQGYSTMESMTAWLESIVEKGEWGVTMTHGINAGWDRWEEPQVYWDFLKYAGGRSDDIWFGTFGQVSAYNGERDACKIEVRQCGRKLVVKSACNLDSDIFTEPLTLKITWKGNTILKEFNPFDKTTKIKI